VESDWRRDTLVLKHLLKEGAFELCNEEKIAMLRSGLHMLGRQR
jgi:hypothetical protein